MYVYFPLTLNYLQNTDPVAFNKFIVGQTVTDDDSPIVRELPESRTPANVPEVINYNEVEINTGEWKKKLDAAGNEVDTETPVTAKPLEILETAIGVGDDIRLKDRDINRLDDILDGITKVVDGLNIGSINSVQAVVHTTVLERSQTYTIGVRILDSSNTELWAQETSAGFSGGNWATHTFTARTTDGTDAWTDTDIDGIRMEIEGVAMSGGTLAVGLAYFIINYDEIVIVTPKSLTINGVATINGQLTIK